MSSSDAQYEDASPYPQNDSRTTPRASTYAQRIGASPYEKILAEAYPDTGRRRSRSSSATRSRNTTPRQRPVSANNINNSNVSRRTSTASARRTSFLADDEDDKPRTIAASPWRGPYKNKKPDYWRTSYFLPQNSKAGTFGTAKRFQGNYVGGKDINPAKEIPGPGQYGKASDRNFTYGKQRPIAPGGRKRGERIPVYDADTSHGVVLSRARRFPRNYVAGQDVSHALDKPGVGMYSPYYAAVTDGRNN